MVKKIIFAGAMLCSLIAAAQQPVSVGSATYAAYPPAYKAQTTDHPGFNATKMLTRKLYVDETAGHPLPTNDWWTDLMVSQFSGAMWSYPAMVRTASEGATVCFPTHWSDNGTEVLPDSWLRVGGVKFAASEARAVDWHDWDVKALLPAESGFGSISATLVHGSPFTWFEFAGIEPELAFSASPQLLKSEKGSAMVRVGGDLYGLYFANDIKPAMVEETLLLDGAEWLSVAPLKSEALYEFFKPYAASIVRSTAVDWAYDEKTSKLLTTWTVKAENLRDASASAPVVQGFLPHAYRHFVDSTIEFADGADYLTPRGTLRLAAAADGRFAYSYRFSGMLPYYAAPEAHEGYDPELMRQLIEEYAAGGSFGNDTYWGGKGLTQMALNMTFARQTGHDDLYQLSKSKLRAALVDWFTYTPGESTKFFCYYPRWGGMLGFDVSYDSDAFNDHHFHYGYFIYAAALLCMEDQEFARGHGEILRMIVKDYANYDRTDTRFPFLRNLDPWAGHSYAGGLGDHGNDNGNGQESSSEAMQGWGGVYLLGVALGDKAMRDAGIFGWLTESRGVAEYWFDRSRTNYDYSRYDHPYNTNLTSKGIGWWTWFSGDPLWMHSIQWMPVSPCLNYLSEDVDFVKWDFETMMSTTAYSWFEGAEPLARQSVGNVVLCYMERSDPEGAARIFDEARRRGMEMARNVDTGHISYYVIYNHLTYGEIDFGVSADCPTANAYRRADGRETFIVYNPDESTRKVTFYRNGQPIRSVNAPARQLTVFTAEAVPSRLEITSSEGFIIPPGSSTALGVKCYDQYGAELSAGSAAFAVNSTSASVNTGRLSVASSAKRGYKFTVTATAGPLRAEAEFTVNDRPQIQSACIVGVPELLEVNSPIELSMLCVDQYGVETTPDALWTVNGAESSSAMTFATPGVYNVAATFGATKAEARVVVLPVLPDVAHGRKVQASSRENVGTAPENAVDGDPNTRWGSAHTESEWFMVDLGSLHKITSVTINWETAYAADYDVEVSTDNKNWTVAFEQRGLGSAGTVRHSLSAEGRYVRINCLRRATQYGYSIIELQVGAISASVQADAVIGLDIIAPVLMAEGVASEVGVRGFTLGGSAVDVSGAQWNSTPAGRFVENRFTPLTYGSHTLTARVGALSASAQVLVEESVKLASLSVTPEKALILTGDEICLTLEGLNQFGGLYPIESDQIAVAIEPAEGAEFDLATGIFRADRRGDYVLTFNGGMARAEVSVRNVSEANIAAGKPARASSTVGGNSAACAVDLDMETRWESRQADGEWLAVDLESPFVLTKAVINWEGAYASAYTVETSLNGLDWFTAAEVAAGHGGREEVILPSIPASELRVVCKKRATDYGNSIYELEVFGSERFEQNNNGVAPRIESIDLRYGNGLVGGTVAVGEPAFIDVVISNSTGVCLGQLRGFGTTMEFEFGDLLSGDYTIEVAAEDAFGNRSAETRIVQVEYSLEGVNVALRKPATATSAESGALTADKAVDGDTSTRWGSEFRDGEAITVDLVNTYELTRIRIVWNNPAYATDYLVETSTDGVDFLPAIERTGWTGETDDAAIAPTVARFVRLTGLHRATPYGTSIDELEVYACAILPPDTSIGELQSTASDSVSQFDLLGRPISTTAPGLHLVRGRKPHLIHQ